jgi:hypothetical protein
MRVCVTRLAADAVCHGSDGQACMYTIMTRWGHTDAYLSLSLSCVEAPQLRKQSMVETRRSQRNLRGLVGHTSLRHTPTTHV